MEWRRHNNTVCEMGSFVMKFNLKMTGIFFFIFLNWQYDDKTMKSATNKSAMLENHSWYTCIHGMKHEIVLHRQPRLSISIEVIYISQTTAISPTVVSSYGAAGPRFNFYVT